MRVEKNTKLLHIESIVTSNNSVGQKEYAVALGLSMIHHLKTHRKPARNLPLRVFWQVSGCSIINDPHIISLKIRHLGK